MTALVTSPTTRAGTSKRAADVAAELTRLAPVECDEGQARAARLPLTRAPIFRWTHAETQLLAIQALAPPPMPLTKDLTNTGHKPRLMLPLLRQCARGRPAVVPPLIITLFIVIENVKVDGEWNGGSGIEISAAILRQRLVVSGCATSALPTVVIVSVIKLVHLIIAFVVMRRMM